MGCPVECTAPGSDKAHGCPKCKYQIAYKQFESKCKELFKKVRGYKPVHDKDWPIDLLKYYMEVAIVSAGKVKRGHARDWNFILGRLVDIYRDESGRMQSVDSWNHRQEMKALLESLKGQGSGSNYDEE